MHEKFLQILKCPKTGSSLNLRINEKVENGMIKNGMLISQDGGFEYPIIDFIPRFIAEEYYSSSFGYEWKRWPRIQFESDNIGGKMEGHTLKMFEKITEFSSDDFRGKLVVDFGCGPGRFLDIAQKKGGLVVGIDMSMAVECARNNFKDNVNVLIVQGDVLNPPFREGVFDFGYTIGVLHHTPDPQRGLVELASTVKSGGKVVCCVYPRDGSYNFLSVLIFRKIYKLLVSLLTENIAKKIAVGYSYFSAYVLYYIFIIMKNIPFFGRYLVPLFEKYLFVVIPLLDVRWRVLDVFDAITPFHASTHTPEELKKWFNIAGIENIKQSDWGSTSFVGFKK